MEPNPPKIAIIDGDLICYPAASSAQKTIYQAVDPEGNIVAEFDSARKYKDWIENFDFFPVDLMFDYQGDSSQLTRVSSVRVDSLKVAKSNFNSVLKGWLERSGVEDHITYLSPKSGARNFRMDVALRKEYKGNRKGTEKPHHLSMLREWAFNMKEVKRSVGNWETDDRVCALAQKMGDKAVLIQDEKDGLQVQGTWVFYPSLHDKPVWSDPNTVGWLDWKDESKKKLVGLGVSHLMMQVICGDSADNYSGLDGGGKTMAHKTITPYNNMPSEALGSLVRDVAELYKGKYGYGWNYVNKEGQDATADWIDFFEESVRLAYMLKHRDDYPHFIMDHVREMI